MRTTQKQFSVNRAVSNFRPTRFHLAGVLFGACLVFLCSQATADVIYQNYDGLTPGSDVVDIYRQAVPPGEPDPPPPPPSELGTRAGVAFTTDGSSYVLDSVTVNLELFDGSLEMHLYSNSGSVPGVSLGVLGNPASFVSQDNYTFTGGGLLLEPNTPYWLVLEPGAALPSSTLWFFGTSEDPFPIRSFAICAFEDNLGPWGRVDDLLAPSAYIVATPVPEPRAYGLAAAIFLMGVAAFHSLRRQRQSRMDA